MIEHHRYIERIVHPDGAEYDIVNTEGGLITSLTYPNGGQSSYVYGEDGKLVSVEDAASSEKTLSREVMSNGDSEVTLTSGEGRVRKYRNRYKEAEADIRSVRTTVTFPNGASNVGVEHPNGVSEVTFADGTKTSTTTDKDPRFGMWAPVACPPSPLSGAMADDRYRYRKTRRSSLASEGGQRHRRTSSQ